MAHFSFSEFKKVHRTSKSAQGLFFFYSVEKQQVIEETLRILHFYCFFPILC